MTQDKSQNVQFLLPGILVNHSVKLGSAEARKMTATSGRTSLKLLHTKDPLGAFSKTFMATSHWASTKCYLTWKPKATPQGRLLFQLAVSMPRTKETDCGSSPEMWATPVADDTGIRKKKYSQGGTALSMQASQAPTMWPTPDTRGFTNQGSMQMLAKKANSQEEFNGMAYRGGNKRKFWPTPRTRDHKGGYPGGRIRDGKVSWDTLDVAVQHTDNPEKTSGSLNPQWVEWLMGYPEGWTDLKD